MVGRKEEKKYLLSLIDEEEPQFIAVFGRRRIGKTYLVRESFGHKFTFQHTGISNNHTKYAIHPTLITTYGVEENAYSGEIQAIITSEALFA